MSVDIKVYTTSNANLRDPEIIYTYIDTFQVLNREDSAFATYFRITEEPAAYFKEQDIAEETLATFDCYVWDKERLHTLPDSPLKQRILKALVGNIDRLVIFQPF